jgi:hypothetical protein
MSNRTRVLQARQKDFEFTSPPAGMPETERFVPAVRERAAVAPIVTELSDPYAAHLPQQVQQISRYESNPESRARSMVMRVNTVTLALAALTLAGMTMLSEWSFFLWLFLASLEWCAVFVVLSVLDYREQPASQSRMVADRYIRMMEREQQARLRAQYGDDYE